jgi:predicted small lipoprotein YifL
MEGRSVSVAWRVTTLIAAILLPVLLTSCGKKGPEGGKNTAQKSEDDFLDKDAKPDERKYLLAAKPFFIAIANRKYADAYALLSSHARARMSFNQFTPAEEQATFQQYESQPYSNVTAEQFAYLMQYVEAARGAPRAPKMLSVFSTDPDVLNRRSKEQFGAMDSMFAIGAMPDWIPADIRRASLRGQIHTELSPQELERVAQTQGISVEEMKKSEDFDPYFNLKVVLVEEGGQLKVGYFEFLPPSMMD